MSTKSKAGRFWSPSRPQAPRRRRGLGAAGALVALLFTLGCEKQVGSSCERGDSRCLDPAQQLICSEGKMIAMPCRGPQGCLTQQRVMCDISANQVGDACSKDDEGAANCAEGGKAKIVCRAGRFAEEPCRGPRGCVMEGERARCDQSLSAAGDPCTDAGGRACDVAGTNLLSCKDGKMALELACRGAGGCQSLEGKLDCDFSVAKVGDPCPEQFNGKEACADDKLGMVLCKAGKFELGDRCKEGELCSPAGGSLKCEKPETK